MPRKYSEEFRTSVLSRVAARDDVGVPIETVAEVASDVGISETCIRRWLARGPSESVGSPESLAAEVARLNADVRALKEALRVALSRGN